MARFAAKMRQWLGASGRPARPLVHYAISCGCGLVVRGERQARHQVARCTTCGQSIFILPASPLPPVAPLKGPPAPLGPSPPVSGRPPRRLRRASRPTLFLLGLILLGMILPSLSRHGRPGASDPESDRRQMRFHQAEGREALREGNFQSAVDELNAACLLRARQPSLLPAAESRELTQLLRQALLLADLLTESLEEILRRLDGLEEREWQAAFARRYAGKSVVFYTTVRRDASGRYRMDYRLFAERQEARLELEHLNLFAALPLEDPQQLLFGARLAGVRREPAGAWVLSLGPDSGVLLTDRGAASACLFPPFDAEQLEEVLRRQVSWLNGEWRVVP